MEAVRQNVPAGVPAPPSSVSGRSAAEKAPAAGRRFRSAGVVRYIRAAPFPHLTSAGMGGVALFSGPEALLHLEAGSALAGSCFALLSAAFSWGAVLCQADALSRFREYQRVRAILSRYGFRRRALRPVSTSRCQRDAALLAAEESGVRQQARRYFRDLGYRWYHILPDRIVSNPLYFFHPDFLKATFLPAHVARRGWERRS